MSLCARNLLQGAPADLPRLRAQLAAAENAEDNDAIVELSRRILENAPNESRTWEKLARTQLAVKDFERCKTTLDRWEKAVKPRPAAIDDLRGDVAFEEEGFQQAERHWLAFIAAKPSRAEAANTYAKLADFCVVQSRWQENLDFRTRIVELKESAANRVGRATALLRLHRWDEAYIDINKANALDPSDQMVKEWLPQFERLQKFLSRLKELDTQIAKSPNDTVPLLDQARVFTIADRPLLALENCQKAMKLQPASMRARIQTAEAFLDTNNADEAAKLQVSNKLARANDKHVKEAALGELGANDARLLQNPKDANALIARAQILHNLNQFILAQADARAALALNDKLAAAHSELAHDLDELGQKRHALAEARKATELDPNDWMKWLYRGMLEKERADFSAAIESQTRSLAIHESIFALDERAECERRLGKTEAADGDVRRLRQVKP